MKIRNSKDLKLILVKKDKTARWLAQQLGYSTQYMYNCILVQKQDQIDRMIEILKEV